MLGQGDQSGYEQTIPLDWLAAPTQQDRNSLLEFTRGALFSCSLSAQGQFDAVHTSRIRSQFTKIGNPGLYRIGLRLLVLLGEAENLAGGFWLPAPFRTIQIDSERVFVGAIPSTHSQFAEATYEGLARIVPAEVGATYPRQSIDNWMGAPIAGPSQVISDLVAAHAREERPTTNLTEVEYLSLNEANRNPIRPISWVKHPVAALAKEHIAICRQPHHGYKRYFSARICSGSISSEAPIFASIPRLQAAIAYHSGAPLNAFVRRTEGQVQISIHQRAPIEEYRLALLLSRKISRSASSTIFAMSPRLAPPFLDRMAHAGFAIEEPR